MKDIYKESLINENKKSLLSFYSITEKQEESSNSSINDSKFGKQLITDNSSKNHFLKNNEIYNIENISVPGNNQKILKKKNANSFNQIMKDKQKSYSNHKNEENKFKKYYKKESDKKIKDINKRKSVQHNNHEAFQIRHIRSSEQLSKKRRNSSSKNMTLPFQMLKKFSEHKGNEKKNLSTLSNFFSKKQFFSLFGNISKNGVIRNKSFNISSSGSNIDFYNSKNLKSNEAITNKKRRINIGDERMLQMSLFEKLKESPMFEKSEKIIFKQKIIYGLLGFFSSMSIIFQISDAILYNRRTREFLEKKNKKKLSELNNIKYYYIIKERNISAEENCMRIFNLILSLFCVFLNFYLYFIKNKFIKQTNKNTKEFYTYYNNYYNHRKKRNKNNKTNKKDDEHISIVPNDYDMISKKKLPKSILMKRFIICIINGIFYPPSINKIIIMNYNDVIQVFSLNNIILLFGFLKLINVYSAIAHLSRFNNLINKTIAKTKMVKIDFFFMIRYFLHRYPIIFVIINLLFIGLAFFILIYCAEYFSLNIKKGNYNNKGENNLKNFNNIIYLYLFYFLKNIYGDFQPISFLGTLIMITFGTIALFIISYFFYHTNRLIKFNQEEQKAYSKLIKILNPINKEHKAANLIKYFIIIVKKLSKDYKNIGNDYLVKKKSKFKTIRKISHKRHNLFHFRSDETDIYNNYTIFNDYNENNERENFITYLIEKFILKSKIISECNILKNNLLIARNFNHSFTDLLKTLGQKMDENLYQLNNKLQFMEKNEKKCKDFINIQKKSLKQIKKVIGYQYFLLNYLINRHNKENYQSYLSRKKKLRQKIV